MNPREWSRSHSTRKHVHGAPLATKVSDQICEPMSLGSQRKTAVAKKQNGPKYLVFKLFLTLRRVKSVKKIFFWEDLFVLLYFST